MSELSARGSVAPKKTILIVDDSPENIDVLGGVLKADYIVKAATSGEKALKIMQGERKPDLILLDVMMPDMDGYEVCRRLKLKAASKHIPVIFVSAKKDPQDTAKGFEVGAIDYINKPIAPAIVKARVKNCLVLHDTQKKLQVALDRTLMGSIEVLVDVLSLTNPVAFGRSASLRKHVRATAKKLGYKKLWTFEIAAILSQLGCITLPTELLERIYQGLPITKEEQELYNNHPKVGQRLLQRVPNMESAAEIIGLQNITTDAEEVKQDDHFIPSIDESDAKSEPLSEVKLGVSLLQMALHLDDMDRKKTNFSNPIVEGEGDQKQVSVIREKVLPLDKIMVGMVLVDDVYTRRGMMLIKSGTEVNKAVLERLRGFSDLGNVKGNRFKVRCLEKC